MADIGNIRAIIFSLVAVVSITVSLISANSMAMTMRDRTSEVAPLRTLGFGTGRIAYLLFGEAIVLGVMGGAIGVGAAPALFGGGMDYGSLTCGLGLISISAWGRGADDGDRSRSGGREWNDAGGRRPQNPRCYRPARRRVRPNNFR